MSSSRDEALGSQSGLIEAILQGYEGVQPGLRLKSYQTPLTMSQLTSLLQGQQGRDLGLAGRQAGAQAAAYGLNPSSAIQRSQSPIYGEYAKQFTDLPFRLGAYNLQQFAPILQLLAMKSGIAGQRADESGGIGGLIGNLGSAAITKFSDKHLKRNIKFLGIFYHGLPIYSYKYLWSNRKQIGVIAQDVEKLIPEAVSTLFGFKRVNYGRI